MKIPLLRAEYLNDHCHCATLEKAKLEYPRYFSDQPHFLSERHLAQIRLFISAYESALRQPVVQSLLGGAPAAPEKGLFNSYDFHIGENGPQLIEINTNAAGAVLGLNATRDLKECCPNSQQLLGRLALTTVRPYLFNEQQLVDMFRSEYQQRFPARDLQSVVIVDENPEAQFFYPEFVLVRDMLRRHGIAAVIAAPEELTLREHQIFAGEIRIDLVYNRLTDFALERPEHAVLRQAYERGMVTVSPNPALHTLYARKSNLAAWWSAQADAIPGIERIRAHVPRTLLVTDSNRDDLWRERKRWFFKPVAGFGGKAVYRGDKITQKVWAELPSGAYIAQEYIPPKMRQLKKDLALKYDLRVYTYGDEILGMLARYYQGQATNFRTEHGGLASVMVAA